MDCKFLFSDYQEGQHSEFSETHEVLAALLDPSSLDSVTQTFIESRAREPCHQAPNVQAPADAPCCSHSNN